MKGTDGEQLCDFVSLLQWRTEHGPQLQNSKNEKKDNSSVQFWDALCGRYPKSVTVAPSSPKRIADPHVETTAFVLDMFSGFQAQ